MGAFDVWRRGDSYGSKGLEDFVGCERGTGGASLLNDGYFVITAPLHAQHYRATQG